MILNDFFDAFFNELLGYGVFPKSFLKFISIVFFRLFYFVFKNFFASLKRFFLFHVNTEISIYEKLSFYIEEGVMLK